MRTRKEIMNLEEKEPRNLLTKPVPPITEEQAEALLEKLNPAMKHSEEYERGRKDGKREVVKYLENICEPYQDMKGFYVLSKRELENALYEN